MADIPVSRYNIDSAMELVADQFSASLPSSQLFRDSTSADRIFLQSGLLSGTGGQVVVASIAAGIIDEYETTIRTGDVTTRIRGRDASFRVLDSYVRKIYKRQPLSVPLGTTLGQGLQPPPANNPSGEPYSLGTPAFPGAPEIVAGIFTASQIAADICATVGVNLAWGTRDYTFLEDFSAVGRAIDLLRRLIEPWTLVEPMRADIFFRGDTVIIQPRTFPITAPDYQIALADLRRAQTTIRKRRTKRVGVLTLNGQKVANVSPNAGTPEEPPGIRNLFIEGTQTEEDTQETFNPAGNLVSLVHSIRRYNMPSHTLIEETKSTYTKAPGGTLVLTLRESVNNTWEPAVLDTSGARSQPRQRESLKTVERIDPSDTLQVFRVWDIERTGFSYDDGTFLTGETTETQTFSLENDRFESKRLVVKTIRDKGSLLTEQTTEVYSFSFEQTSQFGGTFTSSIFGHWELVSRDTQTAGGRRAGGPGRGLPVKRQGAQAQSRTGGATQIQLVTLLSSDPEAVDVSYSNVNLTQADLEFIRDQFTRAQNLWEYEVQFNGPAQAWLQRGNTAQITSVAVEGGNTISLPPVLITESRMEYDESGPSPKVTSILRGFGWKET